MWRPMHEYNANAACSAMPRPSLRLRQPREGEPPEEAVPMSTIAAHEETAVANGKRVTRVGLALASLSLSMLLASLGASVATVALPTLPQAFHASFQTVQWIVLAYLLAITMLIVSAGRLGDITGRRRLLLAGLSLFATASLVCAVAPT